MEESQTSEKVDRHANTTSSMYITSTFVAPNIKVIIKSVSTILYSQITEEEDMTNPNAIQFSKDLAFFNEQPYYKQKIDLFDDATRTMLTEMPTVDHIYEFLKALHDSAKFSPECFLIALVYINRLISSVGAKMKAQNWRPFILCSLLIAQKVWDDSYVSNGDFAYIYPVFDNTEINILERKMLQLLQYNVTVQSSVYAQYYFELRSLYKGEHGEEFPLKPLDLTSAQQLEKRSLQLGKKEQENKVKETTQSLKITKERTSSSRAIVD